MVYYKDRLAEAMRLAGVSEHQLAKALGMTYTGVKKALKGGPKGTSSMSAENNSRAAALCRVNPDWLATGEGRADELPATVSAAEAETLVHLRVIQQLNPETYAKLRAQLGQVAEGLRSADALLKTHGVSSYVTPERAAAQLGRSPVSAPAAPYSFVGGMSNFGGLDELPEPKAKKKEAK